MKNILAIGVAIALIIAIWWYWLRGDDATTGISGSTTGKAAEKWKPGSQSGTGTGTGGSSPATDKWGNGCFTVPQNFPRYEATALPPEAKTLLGFDDTAWTPNLQDRLLGFFVAIDTVPSAYALNYFGKEKVLQYLNSPEGQFPSNIVVLGSLRCSNNRLRPGAGQGIYYA